MAKIIPAKLAEATQRKNVSMATIQEVTGVSAKDIYNDLVTDEEISKISKFLGVNSNFLIRPEITYKDRQDLKAPLDWSLTIPEGTKLKKDGTIDRRATKKLGISSNKKGTHIEGYIPNKLVKDMVYMIFKDRGYTVLSLNACVGYHIDILVGQGYNAYINPNCVINLCYYLDCDPSDIYDGPIDIDHISRKILSKDKFNINKEYRGIDTNTLKAIAKRACIPDKFMSEFFGGAFMSRDLMQRVYDAFCYIRKAKEQSEISPKDFCNCPKIVMKHYNVLPKETQVDKKESSNKDNSYTNIKKSFVGIISCLNYEELDAYKELLESEKMRRDANDKINKYL